MFSIVIPYYKKRKYIERCIDSVLNQTFQEFEIIIIDDGSEDDLKKIVQNKYNGKLLLIEQANQGVAAARNKGISLARYDYIAFLDADDFWSPFYLEKNYDILSKQSDIKIIGSHYSRARSDIEYTKSKTDYFIFENYFKSAVRNTYFTSSTSVILKEFFLQNKGFNSELSRGEDIDVWLRVVLSGGNAVYIKNTMVYYSDEDDNQATKTLVPVENTLVGTVNTYYKEIMEKQINPDFNKFVSKYVYLNLYPYYFNIKYNCAAKKNLNQNFKYYFFLHLPYYLPVFIGEKILRNKKLSKFFRNYLKFFTRYIYK